MATMDEIAEATAGHPDEEQELRIGPPFAIAHDCALREGGCSAVLECECGQAVRLNLLAPGVKQCPNCKARYSHVLLVANEDNEDIIEEALGVVFEANGVELPGPDDEDDEQNPDEGLDLPGSDEEHIGEVLEDPEVDE
jgi:hypothetical protein